MSQQHSENYWYVHGQAYNLTEFAAEHPGGQQQLINLKGKDCTEMIYYMHASASVKLVKKTLEKYKVNEIQSKADSDIFTWKEDGFYENVCQKVKDHFTNSNGTPKNRKANTAFWFLSAFEATISLIMMYWWIFKRSYISPFIAGMITISLGFVIFHAAGHCAISKNPKINYFFFKTYANYVLGFFDKIWELHHNYGHHSYTNIHRKDPDVSNSKLFIRKSEHQVYQPKYKYQFISAYVLLVFLPNQWLGQVIQYATAIQKSRLFGMPINILRKNVLTDLLVFTLLGFLLFLIVYFKQGIAFTVITFYLYSTGAGLVYWACVFPNHDTDLSEQSSLEETKLSDWGEHQVRHTSNFRVPEVLSFLMGGMNYQIEHHLFPAIHPRHYSEISKIVQDECQKRNIPYHSHCSWFNALKGNFKHLTQMSKPK